MTSTLFPECHSAPPISNASRKTRISIDFSFSCSRRSEINYANFLKKQNLINFVNSLHRKVWASGLNHTIFIYNQATICELLNHGAAWEKKFSVLRKLPPSSGNVGEHTTLLYLTELKKLLHSTGKESGGKRLKTLNTLSNPTSTKLPISSRDP